MEFTDKNGNKFVTEKPREIQFINDMEAAGIPWRTYSGRGMFGAECPGAVTDEDVTEEDIIRATEVKGLRTDSMGRWTIKYTG